MPKYRIAVVASICVSVEGETPEDAKTEAVALLSDNFENGLTLAIFDENGNKISEADAGCRLYVNSDKADPQIEDYEGDDEEEEDEEEEEDIE